MKLENVYSDIANISLEMVDEKRGTCVLSGINYSDLKSILTEADLYIYEDRRKTENELKEIDPKNRYAKNKLAIKVEALEFLEDKQHLIKRLDELITHSINLTHNPKAKLKAYEAPDEYFHMHTRLLEEEKLNEINGITPIIPPAKEYKTHYCRVCDGNGDDPVRICGIISGCVMEYEALCGEHIDVS